MDKGGKLEESLEKAWKLEEVTWWEREKREGRASGDTIDTQDKVICKWTNELCHDSKKRRGLENTEDIQQRNLNRRNQKTC